uniref:CAZy families GH3 protein n=1 Tax=uncultured Flavobacterium sp. TaxID=165435 RepID=A0A060BQ88_9FLAO|nr:CAZy families GH3 protein [uncultured Flavobacterium sp.]
MRGWGKNGQSSKEEKKIEKIISKMTLEEKAAFLCGTGMPGFDGLTPVVGFVDKGRVPGAAGATHAIPRLNIPEIIVADGPAGVRIKPTAWMIRQPIMPQPSL